MKYLKKRLRTMEAQFMEALETDGDPTGSISAIAYGLAELDALITSKGRFPSFPEAFAAWEETQQALEDAAMSVGEGGAEINDLEVLR